MKTSHVISNGIFPKSTLSRVVLPPDHATCPIASLWRHFSRGKNGSLSLSLFCFWASLGAPHRLRPICWVLNLTSLDNYSFSLAVMDKPRPEFAFLRSDDFLRPNSSVHETVSTDQKQPIKEMDFFSRNNQHNQPNEQESNRGSSTRTEAAAGVNVRWIIIDLGYDCCIL